jgi:transposase
MTEDDLSVLPLKVSRVGPTGKRTFDPHGKRRLIEQCRPPGVSISDLELKVGVNANQLRKWFRDDEPESAQGATRATVIVESAFLPVVTLPEVTQPVEAAVELAAVVQRETASTPALRAPAPARLRAQLPNGVTLELECGGRDGALLKAMIEALGRADVSS